MNKRWSSEDILELMKLYSSGLSYDDIGKKIDRSPNAIKIRLEYIVYNNLVNNKSIESLSKTLNTPIENIKQMYYSHKSFRQSRNLPITDITINESLQKQIGGNNPKLEMIKQENQILEEIIKNYQLKNYVTKLFKEGKIDSKIIESITKK